MNTVSKLITKKVENIGKKIVIIISAFLLNEMDMIYPQTLLIYTYNNNIGYRTFIKILRANQANLILLAAQLLRHMLATHVDPHDLVIACTCLSTLQSAASAFYPKLATGQTAAQWRRTPTTATTQQRTKHTNHSATEATIHMDMSINSKIFECQKKSYETCNHDRESNLRKAESKL